MLSIFHVLIWLLDLNFKINVHVTVLNLLIENRALWQATHSCIENKASVCLCSRQGSNASPWLQNRIHKIKFFHGIQSPLVSISDLFLHPQPLFSLHDVSIPTEWIYLLSPEIHHYGSATNGSPVHKLKSVRNVTSSHFLSINMFYP